MEGKNFEKSDLEILISTMNKSSLDFLYKMFSANSLDDIKVLIVNQTTKNKLLYSERQNIRVINSYDKGLSKSRNLALKNALGPIVLISDDDVVYEKDFHKQVLKSFNQNPEASSITYMVKDGKSKPIRIYPPSNTRHTLKTIFNVISVEIAFNLKMIDVLKFQFNESFGLGSKFETAEEFLYLRSLYKSGHILLFNKSFLLTHPKTTSGSDLSSNKITYARAALSFKLYGFMAYLWILKYVFFLLRNKMISFKDVKEKVKFGMLGIKDYRLLQSLRKK